MAKDKHKQEKAQDGAGGEAAGAAANGTDNGTAAAADGRPSLKGKEYEKQLRKLQVELCHLQDWVKAQGPARHRRVRGPRRRRQGRHDQGASPSASARACSGSWRCRRRPTARSRQMYMQRYMQHFPAAGEIVIFDRSWYNRAGVEHVMGFCTKEQHERFLELCPEFEKLHRRRRHHADQVLARGEQRGAGAAVRGADRRTRCGSGSSARWTCRRASAGTTTRAPAT